MAPECMPTPAELARLEEARQAVGIGDVAAEALRLGGGAACYTAPGSWSNRAVGLGLDGPVTEGALDALVEFYRARACPAEVEVASLAHPSLLEGLAARGFRLEGFEHILALSLEALPPAPDASVTIRTVDEEDPAAVEEWVVVTTSGFRPPEAPIAQHELELMTRVALHPRTTCLVACVEGRVVGASAQETYEGFGALFSTSVLPPFRRRGIQRALMLERLRRLRELGATFATIGSAPGISTERNAIRIGFRPAYTKASLVRRIWPGRA